MNLIKYVPMLIVPAISARRLLASPSPSALSLLPTPTTISTDCYPQSVGNGSIVPEPQTNLTNCIEMIPGQQYRLCTDNNHHISRNPYPYDGNDGSTEFIVRAANGMNTTDCNPGMLFNTSGVPSELIVCADGGNGTNKAAPNVISAKNESGGIVVSVYNTEGSGKGAYLENKIVYPNAMGTTYYNTSVANSSAIILADSTDPQPDGCGSITSPPEPTETQNSTQTGSQNSDFTPAQWGGLAAGAVGFCMAIGAVIVRLTPDYWNPVKNFASGRTVHTLRNVNTFPALSSQHGQAIYQDMMAGRPISGEFASNELNRDYPLLARLPDDSILHRRLVKIHTDSAPENFRLELGRMSGGLFHRVEAGSIVGQRPVAGQRPLPFTLIRPPQELQELAPAAPEIFPISGVGSSGIDAIQSVPSNTLPHLRSPEVSVVSSKQAMVNPAGSQYAINVTPGLSDAARNKFPHNFDSKVDGDVTASYDPEYNNHYVGPKKVTVQADKLKGIEGVTDEFRRSGRTFTLQRDPDFKSNEQLLVIPNDDKEGSPKENVEHVTLFASPQNRAVRRLAAECLFLGGSLGAYHFNNKNFPKTITLSRLDPTLLKAANNGEIYDDNDLRKKVELSQKLHKLFKDNTSGKFSITTKDGAITGIASASNKELALKKQPPLQSSSQTPRPTVLPEVVGRVSLESLHSNSRASSNGRG